MENLPARFEKYLKGGITGSSKTQNLLFNQTKIFHTSNPEVKEIGYYNKSSYFYECERTLTDSLYYVIGNFQTNGGHPKICCLTCYDIEFIPDELRKWNESKRPICAFCSNSSTQLNDVVCKTVDLQETVFICSDGHWDSDEDDEKDKRLSGVYKYGESKLLPIDQIGGISFNSQSDVFTFKKFTLTID